MQYWKQTFGLYAYQVAYLLGIPTDYIVCIPSDTKRNGTTICETYAELQIRGSIS